MELSEVNKRLRRLMGFVSHDLRNPLGIILTLSQRMEARSSDDARFSEMTGMINTSAQTALELVQQVLDTTALGSGKLSLHKARVDIAELIRLSIKNYQSFAEGNGVQIRYSSEGAIFVYVDDHRISQVLNNILLNAVKYAPSQSVVDVSILESRNEVTIRCTNAVNESREGDSDDGLYQSIGFGMDIVTEILELHKSEAVVQQAKGFFSVEFSLKRDK